MSHKCSTKKHNSREFTAEQSSCNCILNISTCFLVSATDGDAISCESKPFNFDILFNIHFWCAGFLAGSLCSVTPSSWAQFFTSVVILPVTHPVMIQKCLISVTLSRKLSILDIDQILVSINSA